MKRNTFTYSLFLIFLFCGTAALLNGCGIKPNHLEPPPGAEDKTFPRTYPDPSTDPAY